MASRSLTNEKREKREKLFIEINNSINTDRDLEIKKDVKSWPTFDEYLVHREHERIHCESLVDGISLLNEVASNARKDRGIVYFYVSGGCERIDGLCTHHVVVKFKDGRVIDRMMTAAEIKKDYMLLLYHIERFHFRV